MTFLNRLNSPKCDFTQNWSGSKIIKFQQSQALTSYFESFWSYTKSSIPHQSFWQYNNSYSQFTLLKSLNAIELCSATLRNLYYLGLLLKIFMVMTHINFVKNLSKFPNVEGGHWWTWMASLKSNNYSSFFYSSKIVWRSEELLLFLLCSSKSISYNFKLIT